MNETFLVSLTKQCNRIQNYTPYTSIAHFLVMLCLCGIVFAACDTSSLTTPTTTGGKSTLPTNNGSITYSTNASDVLIRTFYGGGNRGTLNFSPEVSIYGDGSYILGPGLQMQQGKLTADVLQQLLHTLVDTDGLLNFTRQQFNDVPDQNVTFLQLMLNTKQYAYQYGKFGTLQESAADMDAYHRLNQALTTITTTLNGPTHPYTNSTVTLLVHQDFSPDLTTVIPNWTLRDFSLYQLAAYECGVTPPDETGPNADTGCLTYTIPHNAYLPNASQLLSTRQLLKGHQEGEFFEQGLYYHVVLRSLLPDELPQKMIAMLGSQEFNYSGVPLYSGVVPTPTATP
ncbi:MAG: hypothetical protein ACR2H5_15225 [Ktedonobacteraceae bacterium]